MTTSLSVEEQALRTAIDYVPQGLAVFDPEQKLVASNSRYRSLLNLPESLVLSGTPLIDISVFLAERGDFGEGDTMALAMNEPNRAAVASHPASGSPRRLPKKKRIRKPASGSAGMSQTRSST